MGRQESLTVWALGRGPYEDELIQTSTDGESSGSRQLYNEQGRPRNPETKRREKAQVRAANEVMEVTGIVENRRLLAKKALQARLELQHESALGMTLIQTGQIVMVGGLWGVIGLRKRILLYKSYSQIGLQSIIRQELNAASPWHLCFAGLPAVSTYYLADYVAFYLQSLVENNEADENEEEQHMPKPWRKRILQIAIDTAFAYTSLHCRFFAVAQQLNLIPATTIFPTPAFFLPFSRSSPIQAPSLPPVLTIASVATWMVYLVGSAAPLLTILAHGRLKYTISHYLYNAIYTSLPRPTHHIHEEVNSPDAIHGEDAQTLRALEGSTDLTNNRNALETPGANPSHGTTPAGDFGEDWDEDVPQATVSFDIEPTEQADTTVGQWSAELRSAVEPKKSKHVLYKMTELTMMPTLLATDWLKEIATGVLLLPCEAIMVRVIAFAVQRWFPGNMSRFYGIGISFRDFTSLVPAPENLCGTFAIQAIVTGVLWTSFTVVSTWIYKKPSILADDDDD